MRGGVRVYDEPSASVQVLASSVRQILGKLHAQVSRRQHVHGSGSPVLDDDGGVLRFGNDPGEPCEVREHSFWISAALL